MPRQPTEMPGQWACRIAILLRPSPCRTAPSRIRHRRPRRALERPRCTWVWNSRRWQLPTTCMCRLRATLPTTRPDHRFGWPMISSATHRLRARSPASPNLAVLAASLHWHGPHAGLANRPTIIRLGL